MPIEKIKEIASIIEKVALRFVSGGVRTDDDLSFFKKQFSQIAQCAARVPSELIARFTEAFLNHISKLTLAQEALLSECISYGIDTLQRVVIFEQAGMPQPEGYDVLLERFQDILNPSGKRQAAVALKEEDVSEFIVECTQLINEVEQELLKGEMDRGHGLAFEMLLRNFHTIKGDANLIGITAIGQLAHGVEDLLEHCKQGKSPCTDEQITLLLYCVDTLRESIEILKRDPQEVSAFDMSSLLQEIQRLSGSAGQEPADAKEKDAAQAFISRVPHIDFSLGAEFILDGIHESKDHLEKSEESLLALEASPNDQEEIHKIFRAFHTIKGIASFINLDDIKTLTHDAETMMDLVLKGRIALTSAEVDVILASIDATRRLLDSVIEQVQNQGALKSPYYDITPVITAVRQHIRRASQSPLEAPKPKIGDILVDKGIIDEADLEQALSRQQKEGPSRKLGELLVDEGVATHEQISRALQEQQKAAVDTSLKIKIAKLDSLIDMMGELVIIGTQVAQSPQVQLSDDQKFGKDVHHMEKIIREVQSIAMNMRLVPIQPLFQKMTRMIRDLSKSLQKDIEVILHGEDTEIDKNVIELISDPLLHMARNSVDHGIEPVEARQSAGKPIRGRIEFNAYHKSGSVVIEVKDDGQGLNKEKILKKALERGLIKAAEALPDNQIYQLIFEPGFSTAEKVTEVSGRGVGMDVVRRNIERMNGKVEIQTEQGRGSTFIIKLPLTLAIIDGFVLGLGKERYIVPINAVVEFIRPRQQDIIPVIGKGEMLNVRGQLYQLIRLDRCFQGVQSSFALEDTAVCIVESDHGRAGILIDSILGQQQVVIKALGDRLKSVKGLAGGTILGDGRVGLILDVNGIVQMSR